MVIVDKQKSRIDLPVVSSPYQKLSVEFCCFRPLDVHRTSVGRPSDVHWTSIGRLSDVHRTSDGRPSKYNIIGIRGESKGFFKYQISSVDVLIYKDYDVGVPDISREKLINLGAIMC